MSRFLLRRSTNENTSFCHVVNFLTAYKLMSFEESIPLFNSLLKKLRLSRTETESNGID